MKISKQLIAVDSHTMGEPTRIIISGVPSIPGDTMPEKKAYLEEHLDHLRTAVMLEPRGHNDMFGSIITAPTNKEADLGIIFMDGGGYLNMCGHGTIGAMTAAVELGMVEVTEPITEIVMEAPAGLVRGRVQVEDGRAKEVSFTNVPAFLYKRDIKVNVPELNKEITMDISFGGSFFAILHKDEIGMEICPKNTNDLNKIGVAILKAVNEQVKVEHPELKHINTVDLVEIYGPAKSADATYQNVVIFGDGQVDRSPCGTGTSAKMATLFAKGHLKKGELFVYESIIETKFKGKVLDSYEKDGLIYVIPEITASAYITGMNHLLIDPQDPLKYGFSLK
ncbi:MAG: proline racemase [Fusobacteriaceae bacterium]